MQKIIFDNDAATDDMLALLYLFANSEVSIEAITVVGTGEARPLKGAENISILCQKLGKSTIPIAYGKDQPLSQYAEPFPGWLRDGVDALLDNVIDTPSSFENIVACDAVTLIRQILEKTDNNEKIIVLATGPLTNIALLIKNHPDLINKIEKIVIMGGAVGVAGNISNLCDNSRNFTAEWNIYADPLAAKIVFESDLQVVLVPLDVTNKLHVTQDFYIKLSKNDDLFSKIAFSLLKNLSDILGEERFFKNFCLWDPFAAMLSVNLNYAKITLMNLAVDVSDDFSLAGSLKLICAEMENKTIQVAVDTNCSPSLVLADLMEKISRGSLPNERFFNSVKALNTRKEFLSSKKEALNPLGQIEQKIKSCEI